jgi:hypothetical protein
VSTILVAVLTALVATTVIATVVSHRRVAERMTSLETAGNSLNHRQDLLRSQVVQLDQQLLEDLREMSSRFDAALGRIHREHLANDEKFGRVAGKLSAQDDSSARLGRRLDVLRDELSQAIQAVSAARAAADALAASQREEPARLASTIDQRFAQAERAAHQLRTSLAACEARQSRQEQQARGFSADLSEHASLRRSLAHLDPQADSQLRRAAEQSAVVAREIGSIRDYVHRQLRSGTGESRSVVQLLAVTASLEWSGADILWPMLESLCRAFGMQVRYSEPASARTGQAYWAWTPVGQGQLDGMLREALLGATGDGSTQPAGIQQLRLTLLALYYGGPGILQVGPLLLTRTADRLSASLLTGGDPDSWGAERAAQDPADLVARLGRLPQRQVADLTDWAAAYAA